MSSVTLGGSGAGLTPVYNGFEERAVSLGSALFGSVRSALNGGILGGSRVTITPTPNIATAPVSGTAAVIATAPMAPPTRPTIVNNSRNGARVGTTGGTAPDGRRDVSSRVGTSSHVAVATKGSRRFRVNGRY